MSQPLRLTYQNSDVMFAILNKKPSINHLKIEILLEGETFELQKANGRWGYEKPSEKSEIFTAIGNVIALRYRI